MLDWWASYFVMIEGKFGQGIRLIMHFLFGGRCSFGKNCCGLVFSLLEEILLMSTFNASN